MNFCNLTYKDFDRRIIIFLTIKSSPHVQMSTPFCNKQRKVPKQVCNRKKCFTGEKLEKPPKMKFFSLDAWRNSIHLWALTTLRPFRSSWDIKANLFASTFLVSQEKVWQGEPVHRVSNALCLHGWFESNYKLSGAEGSADLKISKSALLSLNHHNFSNTESMYTK